MKILKITSGQLLGGISSHSVRYNGIVPVYSLLTTEFTIKQKAVGNKGDKIFLSENIYDSSYFRERKRDRIREKESERERGEEESTIVAPKISARKATGHCSPVTESAIYWHS